MKFDEVGPTTTPGDAENVRLLTLRIKQSGFWAVMETGSWCSKKLVDAKK